MITDSLNGYKGTYPDKVRALMRQTRKALTSDLPDIDLGEAEDPVARYDYGPYCLKKRIDGTISGITEARRRLCDILPPAELETMFAFANALVMGGGYDHEVDRYHWISLSSAIWILDELLLSGKMDEIYPYLPPIREGDGHEAVGFPVKHPVYEDDLIDSLTYLIRHRNTADSTGDSDVGTLVGERARADAAAEATEYRAALDAVIALIDPTAVREAVRHYEEKVWEFYHICFSVMAAVEKRERKLIRERDELQRRRTDQLANAVKPAPILLMPHAKGNAWDDILSVTSEDYEQRQLELRRLDSEIDRLEGVTLSCLALPNDREKLVKSLKGIISDELMEKAIAFHVEDPFEAAFALLYLMDTDSRIPWLYFGSIGVGYTLSDQLPYDTGLAIPERPVRLSGLNAALYQHRYKGYRFEDMTDASGEPVVRECAKNLSQLVFSNTQSLIPRVVPDQEDLTAYLDGLGDLSEHEKEAYSLLSYVLVSGRLRPDSVRAYQAMQAVKQLREDSRGEEAAPQDTPQDTPCGEVDDRLRVENDRLRAKNRELVGMVRDMLSTRRLASKQVQQLQQQIEAQKRELSDLREAVYCLGNATGGDVPTEEAIQYPYETPGKIISFGGHESWLKEMRRKLPRVMFIPPDSLPNIDLIRNADAVWLQVNCLSHAHFYRIINAVRQNGIPLRYFSFDGVERCAEQLARSTAGD